MPHAQHLPVVSFEHDANRVMVIDYARALFETIESTVTNLLSNTRRYGVLSSPSNLEMLYQKQLHPSLLLCQHASFNPALFRFITRCMLAYIKHMHNDTRCNDNQSKWELYQDLLPYLSNEDQQTSLRSHVEDIFSRAKMLETELRNCQQAKWVFRWPSKEVESLVLAPALYRNDQEVLPARKYRSDVSDLQHQVTDIEAHTRAPLPLPHGCRSDSYKRREKPEVRHKSSNYADTGLQHRQSLNFRASSCTPESYASKPNVARLPTYVRSKAARNIKGSAAAACKSLSVYQEESDSCDSISGASLVIERKTIRLKPLQRPWARVQR